MPGPPRSRSALCCRRSWSSAGRPGRRRREANLIPALDLSVYCGVGFSVSLPCVPPLEAGRGIRMDDDATLSSPTEGENRGLQTAELSNAMVRLYKELFGRGPTKSHTAYAT